MFFAPENPNMGLWDTWLFPADDAYHLFYLRRDVRDVGCTVVGHAVSTDLVRWEPVRDALSVSAAPAWDSGPLMTGMVVQHHDGRYFMFYGSMVDGIQRIGVAISDDLYHWEKYAGNPIIEPSGPWYETDPTAAPNGETAWRDPFIIYDENDRTYYAFICARVPGGDYTGGGCIAVCRSDDLLHWDTLPPAHISNKHICLEVPDIFQLNGRWYMLYSSAYWFGSYYRTSDPNIKNGTFYLVSDSLMDGWHEPDHDNILLGSRENRLDAYVGRTFKNGDDLYFYHHNVHGTIPNVNANGAFSAIKRIQARPDGQLIASPLDNLGAFCRTLTPIARPLTFGSADWQGGIDFSVEAASSAALLRYEHADLRLRARISISGFQGGAGIVLGYGCIPKQGFLIYLNRATGTVDLGLTYERDGALHRAPVLHRRTMDLTGGAHDILLVVKDRYLDIFVDDALISAFTWELPPHGFGGFYVEDCEARFDDLNVDALEIT